MSIVLYHDMYGLDCYSPVVNAALPYWTPCLERDSLAIALSSFHCHYTVCWRN
uniref:Uncharacterized protein n=1 Tax=Anguilla anguilla TaxID=7936 RepID=A0A0E9X197_ANGAN